MTGAYDTSAYDTCLQEYIVEGPLASAVWADPYNATGSMQMPGNKARVVLGQFNFSIPLIDGEGMAYCIMAQSFRPCVCWFLNCT